ncbi:MAG: cytochrome b/b6 domain-containing protein [Chitinophagales bacterium]|nr:cytochrome b/b6 domain-containing protein [Chitinophagales bacterium]
MSIITKKTFTPLHRALHWILGISIMVSFITGFLRLYWMSKDKIVAIISDTVPNAISTDDMESIAKSIRSSMWEWHKIAAFAIVIVFTVRLIYMLVKGIRFPNPFSSQFSANERFQGLIYILFYLLVAFNIFSGFYHMFGPKSDFRNFVTMMHKWGVYWFPVFFILHIAGNYLAERGKDKGIVSKMIGGD